jgi:hypothetical protein
LKVENVNLSFFKKIYQFELVVYTRVKVLGIISPLLAKFRAGHLDGRGKPEYPEEDHRPVVIKV